MKIIERIHGAGVQARRVRVLSRHFAEVLPRGARVLDIGCGDGRLARAILDARPDLTIEGIDTLLREASAIPVRVFDGEHIPFPDGAFDVAMLVDVLHHTDDPMILLREAVRVSRRYLAIKDHVSDALLARPTLRFMDRVGNARYGVALPCNYWPRRRWDTVFAQLHLRAEIDRTRLGLYPFPASLIFDRSLHFLALLEKQS